VTGAHTELLGPYALGVLDAEDVRTVESHLAGCLECRLELPGLRAMVSALGEVPAEAFLDGPPDGSDLLLARTLRVALGSRAQSRLRRTGLVAAGIVAAVVAAGGVGVRVGRDSQPTVAALPGPSATDTASAAPAGTRTVTVTDPQTHAKMWVTLTPAMGWVRVHATVSGVAEGQRCVLWVLPRGGGAPVKAGSWVVGPAGAKNGTVLEGTALVPPADVAGVTVATVDGTNLVAAQY
jgi:anti-sigma-K factor RskA